MQPVAQLTYASVQARGGRGGWQVVSRAGEAEAGLAEDVLASRVLTRLETPPLPRFPTAEDIADLPRRMLTAPLDDGTGRFAIWHSAPAGPDATGRPGNVFTHAVVLPGQRGLRPAALWRSPSWLAPYGPERVGTAALPSELEVSEDLARTGADYVLDLDVWRKGVFAVLLDAVAAALSGGSIVVLATASPDDAAAWIAAVSLCMTPGVSQLLATSTWETASAHESWGRNGLHLVGLPRTELADLAGVDGVVVIDDATDPELGDWGGQPHVTADGVAIPVTPWSVLALEAFTTPDAVAALARDLDALIDTIPGESEDPAWALAMVRALGEDPIEGPVAAALAQAPPEAVQQHAAAYRATTQAVLTLLGTSTRDRWEGYRKLAASGTGFAARTAAVAYIESVSGDDAWLADHDGGHVRAPDVGPLTAPQAIVNGLLDAVERPFDGDVVSRARRAVHLLDCGAALSEEHIEVGAALRGLARDKVLPVLADAVHADDLARSTQLGGEARRILTSLLEDPGAPAPLPQPSVAWLALDLPSLVMRDREGFLPAGPPPIVVSAAVAAARRGGLRAEGQDQVALILTMHRLLDTASPSFREIDLLLAERPIRAAEAVWLLGAAPQVLAQSLGVFVPTLLAEPRSSALDRLVAIIAGHVAGTVGATARARRAVDDAERRIAAGASDRRAIMDPLLRAIKTSERQGVRLPVDEHVAAALVLMGVLNDVTGSGRVEKELGGLAMRATFTDGMWASAVAAFRRGLSEQSAASLTAEEHVAFKALALVHEHSLATQAMPAPVASLATRDGTAILDRLLGEIVGGVDHKTVDAMVERVSDSVVMRIEKITEARAADRRARELDKALRVWVREHRVAPRKGAVRMSFFGKGQE